jgi:precorrin-3B C17-methyltransferase
LGPGDEAGLSIQAKQALEQAEVVLGYKTYLRQAEALLKGKEVIASGMTHELDRAGEALDLALTGRCVAMVSGGDPGIYAMAGVIFDVAKVRNITFGSGSDQVEIIVIPGIPALAAAASLLGAPLTHDFATVSLSDRLTPWELIEKRLHLAAAADFVIVLYNPKSKGRPWQLGRAMEIVAEFRPSETPVGVVARAMREGQSVTLTTLGQVNEADVDMQTVVIIGNSRTYTYQGRMVTPRGYLEKYPDAV